MKGWDVLDHQLTRWTPQWPSTERSWVTLGLFVLSLVMLRMLQVDAALRVNELFKVLTSAVILTGLINSVVSFHFSANKAGEERSQTLNKALDVATAAARNGGAGGQVDEMNVDAETVNLKGAGK